MEFSTKQSAPEKRATPCIAVGVYAGRKLSPAAAALDRASHGALAEVLDRGDMEGKLGATLLLYRVSGVAAERVLLVGLGAETGLHEREYRDAVRAAVKAAQETGAESATLCFTDIRVEVDAASHALLTTPGAGKWYRSSGAQSSQQVHLKVGAGATVEWLPQESIVFSGAQAAMRTTVELEQGACFTGVETICFGRRASGETFARGSLRLATDIRAEGRLLWRERGVIDGGSALMDSPIGLAGFSVCSTVLAAGAELTPEILAACRAAGSHEADARRGVSLLPQLLVGRYLGHSAEAARNWLLQLWSALRPAMSGREAVAPRIWNT